jgi:hypothetical protein
MTCSAICETIYLYSMYNFYIAVIVEFVDVYLRGLNDANTARLLSIN